MEGKINIENEMESFESYLSPQSFIHSTAYCHFFYQENHNRLFLPQFVFISFSLNNFCSGFSPACQDCTIIWLLLYLQESLILYLPIFAIFGSGIAVMFFWTWTDQADAALILNFRLFLQKKSWTLPLDLLYVWLIEVSLAELKRSFFRKS